MSQIEVQAGGPPEPPSCPATLARPFSLCPCEVSLCNLAAVSSWPSSVAWSHEDRGGIAPTATRLAVLQISFE